MSDQSKFAQTMRDIVEARKTSQSHDPVNNPSHYTSGGIECIDYLQAKLSPEEFIGFLKGNALKYMSRAGKKGSVIEDTQKAIWYSKKLEETLQSSTSKSENLDK